MDGPGLGLGAPILIGVLVGFVAARIMRFRPGPFGSIGLGVLSLFAANILFRLVGLQAPGPLALALGALGVACGLIWLLRLTWR